MVQRREGYGFIAQENGPDVFVHFSAIGGQGRRTLKDGEKVKFVVTQGKKAPGVGGRSAGLIASPSV